MLKLTQTKLHNPPVIGNCFATVVACFLGLKIEDIPPFEDMMPFDKNKPKDNKTWVGAAVKFLSEKGYEWGSLEGHTSGYYLVVGKSVRGVNHVCIYKDGKLWHDPHPDRSGLVSEDYFEYIDKVKG